MSGQRTLVRLTQVPALVQQAYKQLCTYNQVWRLIADGRVPAERAGSKVFIDEAELPVIARELGLTPSLMTA